MDVVGQLNANSGAIVAIATVLSVAMTLLLLLEARTTRNLRREAIVDAKTDIYGVMNIELAIANFGPANARDVAIAFQFLDAAGAVVGTPRRQGETLLAPGERCRFLPSPDHPLLSLNELAEAGLRLEVAWTWADDRRRLWFLPRRHQRNRTYIAADLVRDLFGGWQLTTYDPVEDGHRAAEALNAMHKDLEKVARAAAQLQVASKAHQAVLAPATPVVASVGAPRPSLVVRMRRAFEALRGS